MEDKMEQNNEVYVTYVLGQDDTKDSDLVYPGMRRVSVKGTIRSWRTGQFDLDGGERINAVQIIYTQTPNDEANACGTQEHPHACRSIVHEFVEIPVGARDVQLHIGSLPRVYEEAFDAAV